MSGPERVEIGEPARPPFEQLVGGLDYPMYLVTAAGDGDADGCLVGFASQCSIDPVRFLVCLSTSNLTTRIASEASQLVVHVLRAGDAAVAERFGGLTGDEVEKLDGLDWIPGPGGAPVIAALDWFAGVVKSRHDVGDHVAYVLDVLPGGSAERSSEPALGFQAVKTVTPGHPA